MINHQNLPLRPVAKAVLVSILLTSLSSPASAFWWFPNSQSTTQTKQNQASAQAEPNMISMTGNVANVLAGASNSNRVDSTGIVAGDKEPFDLSNIEFNSIEELCRELMRVLNTLQVDRMELIKPRVTPMDTEILDAKGNRSRTPYSVALDLAMKVDSSSAQNYENKSLLDFSLINSYVSGTWSSVASRQTTLLDRLVRIGWNAILSYLTSLLSGWFTVTDNTYRNFWNEAMGRYNGKMNSAWSLGGLINNITGYISDAVPAIPTPAPSPSPAPAPALSPAPTTGGWTLPTFWPGPAPAPAAPAQSGMTKPPAALTPSQTQKSEQTPQPSSSPSAAENSTNFYGR